ncbi:MAG: hypothetical protein HZB36_01045 [Candidatus Omnitrophica bacterium]|nr:hypothetical protein [Candidatus Omnitrophota bacterium]
METENKKFRLLVFADPVMMVDLAMIAYEEGVHPTELLMCCAEQDIDPFVSVEASIKRR